MNNNKIDSIVDGFVVRLVHEGVGIEASNEINWTEKLISSLPAKYPPSFMSLIRRYVFDQFTAEKITFYSNHGDKTADDLTAEIFKDQIIFKTTTANGFLHFARPADGSYDPLCFDIRNRKNNKEYPVVRLDHESILQFQRIRIIETLYPSLAEFMEKYGER
jgi:hypothetical protein